MKKKIGISFTSTHFQNYWNWFTKEELGDDVELVELSFEKDNVNDIQSCDAFILTGGVDVHPSFYNGKTIYENSPSSLQLPRDIFEEKIYRHAQKHKLPVLGICRGMQLINVLEGGRLIQDLQHHNVKHRKEEKDKEHTIIAQHDTLLSNIAGSLSGHVNSAHHQAIDPDHIGDNLVANAHDDDAEQIIEGLEFKNKEGKGFMLCVQWHPERMQDKDQNPFSQKIKERFLEEVRNTTRSTDADH
ncbi:MAG TPA: gamma-glutamyl-gamma-aminobutyrate hydrolase family protein [Parafilimonas sp.]|nr:gamma-glutamyl-gamma-aminobutyrate hydrolase family protein [Parafilimonas sp.]